MTYLYLINKNKKEKKVNVKVYQLHASKGILPFYIKKMADTEKLIKVLNVVLIAIYPNSNPLIVENSGIKIPSFGSIAVYCM